MTLDDQPLMHSIMVYCNINQPRNPNQNTERLKIVRSTGFVSDDNGADDTSRSRAGEGEDAGLALGEELDGTMAHFTPAPRAV